MKLMELSSHLNAQPERIHMDSLFDSELASEDTRTLVYQQVLARAHKRIKLASRNWKNGRFCFFVIPELVIGIPRYNLVECTKYLISKLQANGFLVRYTYPNLLFISWEHYLNSRQREHIRRTTGTRVDGHGRVIDADKKNERNSKSNAHEGKTSENSSSNVAQAPSSSVYDIDLLLGTGARAHGKN